MIKEKCYICGKEISKCNIEKHLLSHEKYRVEHPEYNFTCKYCNKEFYRKDAWSAHEKRCLDNPDRISYPPGWNKGLTAETDIRVARRRDSVKEFYKTHSGSWLGRTHTQEQKDKISLKMKGNHNNNPNKTGRGKKGWYRGFYCSSTYELAFIIYCLDNNINIERYKGYYVYEYEGKSHRYYPDFIIDGTIYEIKGFWTEIVDIKTSSVKDKPIKVLYRDDLKKCFDYIKTTYDKSVDIDLQDLYDG